MNSLEGFEGIQRQTSIDTLSEAQAQPVQAELQEPVTAQVPIEMGKSNADIRGGLDKLIERYNVAQISLKNELDKSTKGSVQITAALTSITAIAFGASGEAFLNLATALTFPGILAFGMVLNVIWSSLAIRKAFDEIAEIKNKIKEIGIDPNSEDIRKLAEAKEFLDRGHVKHAEDYVNNLLFNSPSLARNGEESRLLEKHRNIYKQSAEENYNLLLDEIMMKNGIGAIATTAIAA